MYLSIYTLKSELLNLTVTLGVHGHLPYESPSLPRVQRWAKTGGFHGNFEVYISYYDWIMSYSKCVAWNNNYILSVMISVISEGFWKDCGAVLDLGISWRMLVGCSHLNAWLRLEDSLLMGLNHVAGSGCWSWASVLLYLGLSTGLFVGPHSSMADFP